MIPPNPFKAGKKSERDWRSAWRLAERFDRRARDLSDDARRARRFPLKRDPGIAAVIEKQASVLRDAASSIRKGARAEAAWAWLGSQSDSRMASALAAFRVAQNLEERGKPDYREISDLLSNLYPRFKGNVGENAARHRAERLRDQLKPGEPLREFLELITAE